MDIISPFSSYIVLATISFFVCFLLRLFFIIRNPRVFSDEFSHLINYCEFRKIGKRPIMRPLTMLEGELIYPPVLFHLLRFISERIVYTLSGCFSSLVDSVSTILVFMMTHYLTNNLSIAFLAAMLFCIAPESVMQSTYLSPRPIGTLLTIILLFSIMLYLQSANILFLFIIVASIATISLTHKMALQAYFFISIGLSIFLNEIGMLIIGTFCAGILLAIIISKGNYLKIFHSHIFFLNFWRTTLVHSYSHIHKNYKRMPPLLFHLSKLMYLPGIIVVFIALFIDLNLILANAFLLSWIILGLFIFTITSFKPFLFLGENHRYLTYINAPVAIIGSIVLSKLPLWVIIPLLGIVSTANAYILWNFNKKRSTIRISKHCFSALSFLKTLDKLNVLCLPHKYTDVVRYFSKKNTLIPGNVYQFKDFMDLWPTIKKPIVEVIKKYNINYILIENAILKKYNLGRVKLLYCNPEFHIYKVI